MTFEKFSRLAKLLQVTVEKTMFDKLIVYFNLLTEWNERINLTAITNEEDVFILHFLDSLAGAYLLPQNTSVCDIGTGAGFPGIVLKIIRPDISLTLMDSLNKKVNFLKEVCSKLDIVADCVHTRAEDAGNNSKYRQAFDVVTSRAVAKLNTLYEYALPLVRIGGVFLAYKANCEEELEASKSVPKILGCKIQEVCSFILPQAEANRTLIICKKMEDTPKHYPRGKNKERENPLF